MSKTKFIIDENVDFPVTLYLRGKGYDVISIAEESPSLDDLEILKKAWNDKRVVITNDKDFGDLVFKHKLKSTGVILFRLQNQSSKAKIIALNVLLNNYSDKLKKYFIVVSESKVRIRKI